MALPTWLNRWQWLVLLIGWASLTVWAAEPAQLVETQQGDLPIILSAPHGGKRAVPEVDARKGDNLPVGQGKFVVDRDGGTQELALQIAQEIERRFGKKPYFVIANAHRKYIDFNRPPENAFEDADAKPVYEAYHDALRVACKDVQKRYHRGLIIDIHGQSFAKDTVFRGTQDGKTVKLLRERFGEAAHAGDDSLLASLKAGGWKVHPDPFQGQEQAGYNGGFIVQSYGSHQGFGIDAIQLEFGNSYRAADKRAQTAATLTTAIATYADRYLSVSAPEVAPDDLLKVAVFAGAGTGNSRAGLLKLLSTNSKLSVREISVDQLLAGELDRCRVLIHPGGSGSAQGKALGKEGREKVRKFVAQGGGFVGICAGAYLATCDYDWSLNILDAKVIDRQHWNRGFGTFKLGLSTRGREFFQQDRKRLSIYYHQGPLLAPAENPDIADFDCLAKFETEIAKNGAPAGVMTGCTAIAMSAYERGRVICFSPHPERTPGEEQLLLQGILWAAAKPK